MPFEVRCPCCMRVEAWESLPAPRRLSVRLQGGLRRPAEAPALAAWRTLDALGEDAVCFGACPACAQPLLAPRECPSRPYTLPAPASLRFEHGRFHGEEGPLPPDAARAHIATRCPPEPRAGVVPLAFTGFAAGLAALLGVGFVLAWAYIAHLGVRIARGEVFTP